MILEGLRGWAILTEALCPFGSSPTSLLLRPYLAHNVLFFSASLLALICMASLRDAILSDNNGSLTTMIVASLSQYSSEEIIPLFSTLGYYVHMWYETNAANLYMYNGKFQSLPKTYKYETKLRTRLKVLQRVFRHQANHPEIGKRTHYSIQMLRSSFAGTVCRLVRHSKSLDRIPSICHGMAVCIDVQRIRSA